MKPVICGMCTTWLFFQLLAMKAKLFSMHSKGCKSDLWVWCWVQKWWNALKTPTVQQMFLYSSAWSKGLRMCWCSVITAISSFFISPTHRVTIVPEKNKNNTNPRRRSWMTRTLFSQPSWNSRVTVEKVKRKRECEVGNNLKMKVYPCVSKRPALHVGDILTDLAEQRRYENNHASGTACQSNLF